MGLQARRQISLGGVGAAMTIIQIAMGKQMYMACAACHGRNLVGAGGPAPDLRESAIPLNSETFRSVVHDGALLARGMPRFAAFDNTQIESLRQYIRFGGRSALERP